MARRAGLSKAELEVARIVWSLGGATVRQVHDALPDDRRLDYKTVQTYLRRLEAKRYLATRREGKSIHYRPRVRPTQVVRETVSCEPGAKLRPVRHGERRHQRRLEGKRRQRHPEQRGEASHPPERTAAT